MQYEYINKKPRSIGYTVRFPPDIAQEIKEIAERQDVSIASVIREYVLNNLPSNNK